MNFAAVLSKNSSLPHFFFFLFSIVQLSTAGGRLIISSDGVWDALSAEAALDCCRGMTADAAAAQIVKVHLQLKLIVCLFVYVCLFSPLSI